MACFAYDYDAFADQPRQQRDWDCSAAAAAWMGRALTWGWEELDVAWSFVDQGIATPELGLLDGTGAGIVRWLSMQPFSAKNSTIEWSTLIDRDWSCPLIMGSTRWYHWTGVRGMDADGNLRLANSAPGWASVYQTMTVGQFQHFGDFWAVQPTA
ncbi:MAG TPA: hypothetical protein VH229_13425 [Candidatus Udaeobacter sp.]|jgi:hypothetical protein|nr:hypothetical protein [Candidatus Udaeobacter sp.]